MSVINYIYIVCAHTSDLDLLERSQSCTWMREQMPFASSDLRQMASSPTLKLECRWNQESEREREREREKHSDRERERKRREKETK